MPKPELFSPILFLLLLTGILLIFRVNPLKRQSSISFAFNIQKAKREKITGKEVKRKELFLAKLSARLQRADMKLNHFYMLLCGAFAAGFGIGFLLFDGMLLALGTAVAFLPLPWMYLAFKAEQALIAENDELENAMSVITNSYLGSNDIVRSVEAYVNEKNRYIREELRQVGPFEEFITEVIMVNPNLERGLFLLSAKINNPYFAQWTKMLVLCLQYREMKFTLMPIIKAMNDAKAMKIESDSEMQKVWRDYGLTVALMFAIIPVLRLANAEWYAILTHTVIGQGLVILMIVMALITSLWVMRINKPLNRV